jgi:nucleoside permease NupC
MNPFDWKHEHRLALAVAAALGAFIGIIVMFQKIHECAGGYMGSRRLYPIFGIDWSAFLGACWFSIIIWPIVGAIIGAALVYIWQLLRS